MIKALVIAFLIGYLIYKAFGLFIKVLVGGSSTQRSTSRGYQNEQYQSGKRTEGNVNIDYVPKDDSSEKSGKNFKGGEYVDYEEID